MPCVPGTPEPLRVTRPRVTTPDFQYRRFLSLSLGLHVSGTTQNSPLLFSPMFYFCGGLVFVL